MYKRNTEGEIRGDGSSEQSISIPPRYSGVRFRPPEPMDGGDMTMRRHKAPTDGAPPARVYRSGSGRQQAVHYSPISAPAVTAPEPEIWEETAEPVSEEEEAVPAGSEHANEITEEERRARGEKEEKRPRGDDPLSSLMSFLSSPVSDDILLGGLILLLAHEDAADDILLLLGLLLAFGKSE